MSGLGRGLGGALLMAATVTAWFAAPARAQSPPIIDTIIVHTHDVFDSARVVVPPRRAVRHRSDRRDGA
jgi:hypothetical protein